MTKNRKPSRWVPKSIEVEKGSPTRPSRNSQISIDRYAELAIARVMSGLTLTGSRLIKY